MHIHTHTHIYMHVYIGTLCYIRILNIHVQTQSRYSRSP